MHPPRPESLRPVGWKPGSRSLVDARGRSLHRSPPKDSRDPMWWSLVAWSVSWFVWGFLVRSFCCRTSFALSLSTSQDSLLEMRLGLAVAAASAISARQGSHCVLSALVTSILWLSTVNLTKSDIDVIDMRTFPQTFLASDSGTLWHSNSIYLVRLVMQKFKCPRIEFCMNFASRLQST